MIFRFDGLIALIDPTHVDHDAAHVGLRAKARIKVGRTIVVVVSRECRDSAFDDMVTIGRPAPSTL